ncbi:hypothetical protein H0H92_000058 [Tricholoma furcatifolium]|nr:hypothetical protein H0H92_000058 [Tricholoma furcatifolium]
MLTHRGFSAWITVDGKPLPEYLVAVDSNINRTSCWIPSEAGKNFAVHWEDHGGEIDTCAYITLDGLVVPGQFLFGKGKASRQGVRTSPSTERPFVFQTVDINVGQATSGSSSKDLGMIVLRIKRVARVKTQSPNSMLELPPTSLGKRKNGDHCIGFGQEARTNEQSQTTWSVVPYEQEEQKSARPSTYVSFAFRYRSRGTLSLLKFIEILFSYPPDFLETQGIAPESMAGLALPPTPARTPMRRVVSLPPTMPTVGVLMPPRKKAKVAMISQVVSSCRLGSMQVLDKSFIPRFQGQVPYSRPSCDARRAVSLKSGLPGEGLLVFHQMGETPWRDSGESSEASGSQDSNF